MNGTDAVTDAVTSYYQAQGKHDRQLARLTKKIQAKWTAEDFEALKATRAARDSAVAALSSAQREKHFLPKQLATAVVAVEVADAK